MSYGVWIVWRMMQPTDDPSPRGLAEESPLVAALTIHQQLHSSGPASALCRRRSALLEMLQGVPSPCLLHCISCAPVVPLCCAPLFVVPFAARCVNPLFVVRCLLCPFPFVVPRYFWAPYKCQGPRVSPGHLFFSRIFK
jgi:hypothetical protein